MWKWRNRWADAAGWRGGQTEVKELGSSLRVGKTVLCSSAFEPVASGDAAVDSGLCWKAGKNYLEWSL